MKAHKRINQLIYFELWQKYTQISTRSAVAMILYMLYVRRKWHKEQIIKLYEDIVELYSIPLVIFGREVNNADVEDYMVKHIPELDFDKLTVNTESYMECVRREKNELWTPIHGQ